MSTPSVQTAARDPIWFVPFGSQTLQSAYLPADASSPVAVLAQQFTVSLETVQLDQAPGHGWIDRLHRSCDLLIVSSTALGSNPQVQRVHYYAEMNAVPLGQPIKDFLADTIYLCKDYSGTDRLWLSLQVVDVPADPKQRESLIKEFDGLTQQVGSIFPVALPEMALVGMAAEAVDKFVDATSKTVPIIDQHVELDPGTRHNRVLLRAGNYVVFHQAIDGTAYRLQDDCTIVSATGETQAIPYAVFSIDFVNDPGPAWQDSVNAQRVATLLTGLNGDNPDPSQASIGFLSDTMRAYSNWKDLERYVGLYRQEQARKGSLTPAESNLMATLAANPDLKPYLPS